MKYKIDKHEAEKTLIHGILEKQTLVTISDGLSFKQHMHNDLSNALFSCMYGFTSYRYFIEERLFYDIRRLLFRQVMKEI